MTLGDTQRPGCGGCTPCVQGLGPEEGLRTALWRCQVLLPAALTQLRPPLLTQPPPKGASGFSFPRLTNPIFQSD